MTTHHIASGHYFVNVGDYQYRIYDVRQVPEMYGRMFSSRKRPWVVQRAATPTAAAFYGAFATRRDALASLGSM